MKVIFRSNDRFAKKTLGQLGGAEELLQSLNRYLSEDALLRLSLFIENTGVSLATLDIVDGDLHVHSSVMDDKELTAIESVINKCVAQLKKNRINSNYNNETIRHNDECNVSFDALYDEIEVNPAIMDCFEMYEVEKRLENEKKTPKYNHIMSKYISYLYRKNDIDRAAEHLRILYSFYNDIDKEEISVADYERLLESINEITNELHSMLEMQECFENNKKDNNYINYIIEEETKLAKLKK